MQVVGSGEKQELPANWPGRLGGAAGLGALYRRAGLAVRQGGGRRCRRGGALPQGAVHGRAAARLRRGSALGVGGCGVRRAQGRRHAGRAGGQRQSGRQDDAQSQHEDAPVEHARQSACPGALHKGPRLSSRRLIGRKWVG